VGNEGDAWGPVPGLVTPGTGGAKVGIPALLGGLFLLNLLLLAPRWVVAGGVGPAWVALEAVLVVGLLALLPRTRWSRALATLLALLLVAIVILALADAAARMSLARPLNLYLDIWLAAPVVHLLMGSLGTARFAFLAAGSALALGITTLVLALLFRRIPSLPAGSGLPGAPYPASLRESLAQTLRGALRPRLRGVRAVGVLLLAFFTLGLVGERVPAVAPQVAARLALPVVDMAREQAHYLSRMLGERERFAGEMAAVPASYHDLPGLLQGLGGRDVVLAFLESYGISALDDPRYAPVIQPRLDDLESRMEAAGVHLVTGALVAPIQGGQSWLGRGSVLSGLWLENQFRYEILLAGERETLVDDFRRAGYRTIALMPAITMAWPEGERFGYDRIHAHRDIDYRGPPLNWVTMPDQFTWWYLESAIRTDPDPRPLFAEVALISSHAPWVPILPVLEDWESIGDGSVFAPWENAGERPEELWRDYDRVREHYALQVDYTLHAMTAYAERFVDEGTLLVVLGDHQPAPLITGDDASRDVPVHVFSRNPELLEPFLAWGFRPGGRPDPDRPAPRMDAFRDWFVRSFSGVAPPAADALPLDPR
jgi:hypothetical protein